MDKSEMVNWLRESLEAIADFSGNESVRLLDAGDQNLSNYYEGKEVAFREVLAWLDAEPK